MTSPSWARSCTVPQKENAYRDRPRLDGHQSTLTTKLDSYEVLGLLGAGRPIINSIREPALSWNKPVRSPLARMHPGLRATPGLTITFHAWWTPVAAASYIRATHLKQISIVRIASGERTNKSMDN